jgi:hypothetical protein
MTHLSDSYAVVMSCFSLQEFCVVAILNKHQPFLAMSCLQNITALCTICGHTEILLSCTLPKRTYIMVPVPLPVYYIHILVLVPPTCSRLLLGVSWGLLWPEFLFRPFLSFPGSFGLGSPSSDPSLLVDTSSGWIVLCLEYFVRAIKGPYGARDQVCQEPRTRSMHE